MTSPVSKKVKFQDIQVINRESGIGNEVQMETQQSGIKCQDFQDQLFNDTIHLSSILEEDVR